MNILFCRVMLCHVRWLRRMCDSGTFTYLLVFGSLLRALTADLEHDPAKILAHLVI